MKIELLSFKTYYMGSHIGNPLDAVNRAVRRRYGKSYVFVPLSKQNPFDRLTRWTGFVGAPRVDPETNELSYRVVDNHVTASVYE